MECRVRNLPTKRVFGRDITNNQTRRPKVNSFSEKPIPIVQNRLKSRSFEKKIIVDPKDPINDYQQEILSFMLSIQKKQKKQLMTTISSDMRQILIDWLVEVHLSFELKEQTLYLALAYLNQYTSICQTTKNDYQLVGITCLWIASKYQEIYPPRIDNYIKITDSSYTLSELKAMEGRILLALKFNLTYTTTLQLLEAVSQKWVKESNGKLTKDGNKTLCMCKYLLQISLFEGLAKQYCMKTLVQTAIMLSDSVLKIKTQKSLDDAPVDKQILMRCFKQMCTSLQNISRPNIKLRAIKKKYSSERYLGVSRFRLEQK